MIRKLLALLLISHISGLTSVTAQVNLSVAGHINYHPIHDDTNLSDVWGYVDEDGNEYALVGMTIGGVSIVDITDPANTDEVFSVGGPASSWYEMKVWNDYAYVTTEGGGGLMIIDLSPLPASTALTVSHFTTGGWATAHNLWIDENGILYIFGADRGNGGYIAYDLNVDPLNLSEVGDYDDYYVHDAIVINDTMYAAHIQDGFFSIIDVADKANPVTLATAETPSHQSHNIWVSDDRHYVYTTDEVSGAYITEYDISDFQNITETDRIQSSPGEGVIPHNAYIVSNSYIISSYFNDGVLIYDISQPGNMVKVGHYDTSPYSGTGFTGVWGTYNWLPSGNIIAGDVTEGLFILTPTYVRGAYLEGAVTDQVTGFPVPNADVKILESGDVDHSDISGNYRMGTAQAGSYTVIVAKPAYRSDTIYNVALTNGNVTTLDVQLVPLIPFALSGTVTQQGSGAPIDSAIVRIENYQYFYEVYTDVNGDFTIPVFYEGVFDSYIGKWQYHTTCFSNYAIDSTNNVLDEELEKGLYEDFTFDNDWTTTATATRGLWEYGKPSGTFFGPIALNPGIDAADNCGGNAWCTGNDGNIYNEVDGTVTLTSPVFDATYISDPWMSYYRWFFNIDIDIYVLADDTMKIMLSNGTETAVIENVTANSGTNTEWHLRSERISNYITPTATMRFIVQVKDINSLGDDHTEAGIDGVQLTPISIGVEEKQEQVIKVYPNPAGDYVTVEMPEDLRSKKYEVRFTNTLGQIVFQSYFVNQKSSFDVSALTPGIYFVQIISGDEIYSSKLVKR